MASASSRRVVFVAFDELTALDLTGPLEVFAVANALALDTWPRRAPPYVLVLASLDGRAIRAESGIRIQPEVALAGLSAIDTLVVPGGRGLREPDTLAAVSAWLRRRNRHIRRIASVCTGVYALAEAGLLDGLRATTHWRHADAFAQRYPRINVDSEAIHIQQDKVFTSAGISAGIDLALALVEQDLGADRALAVARELVMYLRRPGGQRQYSDRLSLTVDAPHRLAGLVAWLPAHLHEALPVERLAYEGSLSTRQLTRLFRSTFRLSPAAYVERLRVDEASQLLLGSQLRVEQVARRVGFHSADVFRRAFERQFSLSPQQYRQRFGMPQSKAPQLESITCHHA